MPHPGRDRRAGTASSRVLQRSRRDTPAGEPPEAQAFAFFSCSWAETLQSRRAPPHHRSGPIWDSFVERVPTNSGSSLSDALGGWAALVAREALQEAVSSIWTEFCSLGLERQGIYGMSSREVDDLIENAIAATRLTFPNGSTFDADPAEPLESLVAAATEGLGELQVEEIRTWIAGYDSVAAGLSALVAIPRLVPEAVDAPPGWRHIGAATVPISLDCCV